VGYLTGEKTTYLKVDVNIAVVITLPRLRDTLDIIKRINIVTVTVR
jgi:hypothetical protein